MRNKEIGDIVANFIMSSINSDSEVFHSLPEMGNNVAIFDSENMNDISDSCIKSNDTQKRKPYYNLHTIKTIYIK